MADEERQYVRAGKSFKEMRKRIGTISDLKDIITKHFNLPHIQVTECSNGGVVIGNLFEGIPEDIESQDHDVFDNLLKLIGWIEGKVFEEMPIDEKQILVKESSALVAHQVLDESPRCDLLSDDDRSTEEKLEIDSSLKNDEELVQIEAIAEPILMESPDLVARHVFGEMLESQQELKQANLKALEVTNLKNASLLLLIRSESAELINSLNALSTQEEIPTCYIGILCYDPGGGSWYPASIAETLLPSSETLHQLAVDFVSLNGEFVYPRRNGNLWFAEDELSEFTQLLKGIELDDRDGNHNLFFEFLASSISHVGRFSHLLDRWVKDIALGSGQSGSEELISLLRMKFDPGGAAWVGIKLSQHELLTLEFDNAKVSPMFQECASGSKQVKADYYVEIFAFDPGGQSLIDVAFGFPITMEKVHWRLYVFTEIDAFIMFLQLMLGHYYLGVVMVQKISSYAEKFFEVNPSFNGDIALVFDPGGEEFIQGDPVIHLSNVCDSQHGFKHLVFDPGIVFHEEWEIEAEIASIFGGKVAYRDGADFADVNGDLGGKFQWRSLKEAQKNLQQVLTFQEIGKFQWRSWNCHSLPSNPGFDISRNWQFFIDAYIEMIMPFDLGGKELTCSDFAIFLSNVSVFVLEISHSDFSHNLHFSMNGSLSELGKRKVNVSFQQRLIGAALKVIKVEEVAEMKVYSLLVEVADELAVFGKNFLKFYVPIGLQIPLSQVQVEIAHKRIEGVDIDSYYSRIEVLRTTATIDHHHRISCQILLFYELVIVDP